MKNIDYKLFLTVVALMVFGVIMISSVSVYSSFDVTNKMFLEWKISEPYNYFYLLRSISHIAISLIIMAIIIKINSNFFEKYSKYFLLASLALLIVTIATTDEIKWAKWWLILKWIPFVIQPTEFLKISVIVFLGMVFKKYNHRLKSLKEWFVPYIWFVWALVLIISLIPDFWTLLVLVPITWIMFFYAWANKKYIATLWVLWIMLFGIVYSLWKYNPVTWESTNKLWYVTQRIDNFFKSNEELFKNKTEKWDDRTHQTKQWLITIWSWWFSGKWFWQSIQKFWYLPEVQWDFIFAVIVEELGFRWWLILVLMYLYIGYRWFYISYNVKDKFHKYVSLWITSWILFQTFINIWVNLNIVPLTWVTLPFVSYGWSSLLSLSIWVWILLGISRNVEEKPIYARMGKNRFIF